jgi:spermidine synthase
LSWIFESKIFTSKKNGEILVRRILGNWIVSVGGCQVTGPYLFAMWVHLFKLVSNSRNKRVVTNVLMIGLGGGGQIQTIYRSFPGCLLTVIEHDSVMISIACEIGLYQPYLFPRIIEGDGIEVIKGLRETFDIIVLDIFTGPNVSPSLAEDSFINSVKKILSIGGTIVVNAYQQETYLITIKKHFNSGQLIVWRMNNLGIFSD